jgi:hypothetical protein
VRAFLNDLAIFAALQLALLAAVALRYPGPENTYLAATLDKHASAALHPPPRILFVGGSGVAFGIDSPAVEAALGRRPLNLGLHAALGADFLLNEARSLWRRGDALVLCLEYEHFLEDQTSPVLLDLLEIRPASVRYVSLSQGARLLDQGLVWLRTLARRSLRRGPRPPDAPGYAREAFNEYGDVVAHHDAPRLYVPEPPSRRWSHFDMAPIERMARRAGRFARDAESAGVSVFWLYPPLAAPEFESRRPFIAAIAHTLARVPGLPRLNDPEDVAFPVELFYDTPYHLTRAGKTRHTEALVRRLSPLLRPGYAVAP